MASATPTSAGKPLVFFSASGKDYEWRDRLKRKLLSHSDQLELWDDSNVQTGSDWQQDISAAINRARIAVVLLSPHYVESKTATEEFATLASKAESGQLRLFPVILQRCKWRDLPHLQKVMIWSSAKPILEQGPDGIEQDLEAIAEEIVELAQRGVPAPPSGVPTPTPQEEVDSGKTIPTPPQQAAPAEFQLSLGTQQVLKRARDLAEQSQRTGVTSSCLLFAFADLEGSPQSSGIRHEIGVLIRGVFDRSQGYDDAFQEFLEDSGNPARQSAASGGPAVGPVSANMRKVLERAAAIASQVSGSSEIHTRHLFGALLLVEGNDEPRAWKLLFKAGASIPQLRSSFRQLLSPFAAGDNLAAWDTILLLPTFLPPQPPPKPPEKGSGFSGTRALRYFVESLPDIPGEDALQLLSLAWKSLSAVTDISVQQATDSQVANVIVKVKPLTDKPDSVLAALDARPPDGKVLELVFDGRPNRHWNKLRFLSAAVREVGLMLGLESAQLADQVINKLIDAVAPQPTSSVVRDPSPAPESPPPIDPFTSGPAGFTREFTSLGGTQEVPDHLEVRGLAHRLADLISLRETRLPLAVGLFGNWGSGKSHFMNLIDRQLKKRADEKPEDWAREAQEPGAPLKPDPSAQGPWCQQIVRIYFNAWHYLDANLWASLVTKIFEDLFLHLSPKGDQLEKLEQVQKQLLEVGGATARAEVEASLAQAAVVKARNELAAAEQESAEAKSAVDGMLDRLSGLLPNLTRAEDRQKIAELFGIPAGDIRLTRLQQEYQEVSTLGGQIKETWQRIFAPQGRAYRLGWLIGALVLVPLLIYAAGQAPGVKDLLDQVRSEVQVALGLITTVGAAIAPFLVETRRRLSEMSSLVTKAEEARETKENTPAVREAQAKVVETEQNAQEAQRHLVEVRAKQEQLKKEEAELAPARRIARFIETRAQSTDYRGQLGLVSLARRDFQELSDLFADVDALEEKKKNAKDDAERKKLDELSQSIDRIVLFVDDLDRCQPEKVVEVLQAVHLLLAFPLFAVVVGVDQRCLRQSLRMQFKGLLTPESDGDDWESELLGFMDEQERPATPLDYLEKIFHVPFHLPPMQQKGFEDLVENLANPKKKTKPDDGKPKAVVPPKIRPPVMRMDLLASARPPGQSLPSEVGELLEGTQRVVTEEPPPPAKPPKPQTPPEVPQTTPSPPREVIGSVPLDPWERESLKKYHRLIRTPRGVTRLLNTYRLVRAGVAKENWEAFCKKDHRVMMLLLASAAGYPAVARDWFSHLRTHGMEAAPSNGELDGWTNFQAVYDATFASEPKPDKEEFSRWLPLVEQFAF